jgi:hypothetical protein
MTNLSWLAAPILAQRNIELHSIDVAFDEANRATVYTVREATGKIGTFSIPTLVLAGAVEKKTVDDLLRPLFETVEFSDGKPVIPEVQRSEESTPDGAGQLGTPEATVNADGTTSPSADHSGDSTPTARTTRKRSKPRQPVKPVDEGSGKPAIEPGDEGSEGTEGPDGDSDGQEAE